MARGKLKRNKDKRNKKFNNNRKKYQGKKRKVESFRKRDSSHQKDSKETHHIEDSERAHKRRKVVLFNEPKENSHNVDDDYPLEGEEDIFKQLVTEFSNGYSRNQKKAVESDTSSEDDSEVEIERGNINIIPDDEEEEEETVAAESDDSSSDSEEESLGIDQEKIDDRLDPFVCHFHYDLEEIMLETLYKLPHSAEKTQQHWPVIGQFILHLPKVVNVHSPKLLSKFSLDNEKQFAKPGTLPQRITSINWTKMHIKPQIQHNISKANIKNLSTTEHTSVSSLTPCQMELFSLINNYQDLYYPERNLRNREEIRFVYCLHSINHILKTRTKILHHNQKLIDKDDVPEEYRDQGLVRPKVLILVPFRESALRVVKMMMEILVPDEKADIMHKKRFFDEFTGNEIAMPRKKPKPEDYESTFSGNTDDNFRIGISITKKSLRLYADFYSADIIVASPLGLRVIIGAEGEMERDYDFLASIEVLVLDEADIFLMQNWDHLLHVLDHIHLQPKEAHETNFARVRSWALNGWTCYYRQTVLFSSVMLPEFNSLMNKKCHNYAGKICIMNPVTTGSICQLVVQVPQVFQRFEAQLVAESLDARFDFFVKKILLEFKSTVMNHVLIYVPSYFDYVKLRNHFKREDLNFVQICEYSKDGKVARARDMFFHAEAHFLLYSERFHFFRRPTIKGIQHILFYQPPTFPNFYSEICNFMHEINQPKQGGNESNMTVTVLYSKYDVQQLAAIVGTDRAARMVNSERNVHMFMTGE